jgi:hypothetical protein
LKVAAKATVPASEWASKAAAGPGPSNTSLQRTRACASLRRSPLSRKPFVESRER